MVRLSKQIYTIGRNEDLRNPIIHSINFYQFDYERDHLNTKAPIRNKPKVHTKR